MPRPPRLLDVSVLLTPGMPVYPGNPEFECTPVSRIADGRNSNHSKLVMGTHSGTHVDAPLHFFDGRPGVDQMPLDLLIGRSRVIDLPHRGGITGKAPGRRRVARRSSRAPAHAQLGALERHRRLPHRLHLHHRGRRRSSSSTRASRSSASITSRSNSSRSRARRRTRSSSATASSSSKASTSRRPTRASTRCIACR